VSLSRNYTAIVVLFLAASAVITVAAERLLVTGMTTGFRTFFESLTWLWLRSW
jgi:cytochrome b